MGKVTTISVAEGKKKLSSMVDECTRTLKSFVLSAGNQARARLINEKEYESLMETLEVLNDKEQMTRIESALKNIEKGNLLSHKDIFGHSQPNL